jgi:SAM-dependent methyltransferase
MNPLPAAVLEPQTSHSDWLICPDCGGALNRRGNALDCCDCGHTWPVVDGVPHFVSDFAYWGEIPEQQMRQVNIHAAACSWRSALLDSSEPVVQRASGMILNLERANWQWLVDLPPESRVLDLGAGMGTTTHALAARFHEVVAVEPVMERVAFMSERFRQEGLTNARVVRSSLWVLPFRSESFDLVAMNGVLEWVPEGRNENPRKLQLKALEKACGLLRPGGYLYLGIENRMTPGYFVGYPDPHCSVPFVTVLPRPLAHWYARRRGLPGYRNYLYSSRGYRKLLEESGFTDVQIYLAVPSYNHPRYLIPLEQRVFDYFSRTFNATEPGGLRGMLRRLLSRAGLSKYLEYSYVIVARK